MITDYRLLSYNLPHNLEETINNYIKQGWQPYGSPFVDGDHYYQAIVQYADYEVPPAAASVVRMSKDQANTLRERLNA